VDVLLHRLRLTRSRSEAKQACEAGAVEVDDRPAKPSQGVRPGQQLTLRYARRLLRFELLSLPPRSLTRSAAAEHLRIIEDREIAGR
jgi:ribosomal 50S subunit-recycling heat shock protein